MSDPHNFGRRVLRSDEWFLNPRSVYWEEFFMGSSGFLSEFLTAKIPREFLPPWYRLKEKISVISDSSNSGKSLALQSVDPIVTEKLLVEVGSAIAYFTYFGITDLHSENVVFVKNSLNETILTPIDI